LAVVVVGLIRGRHLLRARPVAPAAAVRTQAVAVPEHLVKVLPAARAG
jgi:hypothetical protein